MSKRHSRLPSDAVHPESSLRVPTPSEPMFSPASFGAVLAAASSTPASPQIAQVGPKPIVAFYGFRGGSGRTTALSHVAATLAARGRTVVAIDLDFEAPGLATVLGCEQLEDNRGALALLRAAEVIEDANDERLKIAPHLVSAATGLPPIRVVPAGRLGPNYYRDLDLLNPSLWHVMDGPSPLHMLIQRVRQELEPDYLLIDCRTGLAPLTATALFHEADLVVACFSATRQSHEGAREFVGTLRAAQQRRGGLPSALLVPTMFVETDEGLSRRGDLVEAMARATQATATGGAGDDPDLVEDPIVIVGEGVPFRTSLSVTDVLVNSYEHVAGRSYDSLIEALDRTVGVSVQDLNSRTPSFDSQKVLQDLDDQIRGLAFAEDVPPEQIVQWFLPPAAMSSILAPSTFYIVGAKGSGKSWLYTRMLTSAPPLDPEQKFLIGHGPHPRERQDADFSPEAFRSIEKILAKSGGAGKATFWRVRAAAVLLREMSPELASRALAMFPAPERKMWEPLAKHSIALYDAVRSALSQRDCAVRSERLLPNIDSVLLGSHRTRMVLVYDALDTGFGSSGADLTRRQSFVVGLVEALEGLRGSLRAIGFKVMLREDVFHQLDIQNKSHLRTATTELVWRPVDVWKLALTVAVRSKEYERVVHSLDGTISTATWPDDEKRLTRLLAPLWGAQMEGGRTVASTTFVQRRTADGQDRLFPRTLVEMLRSAVEYELKRGQPPSDRVLSSAGLQEGYRSASRQRLDDLKAEYRQVSPYLEALAGMNPTATRTTLRIVMQNKMRKRGHSKSAPKAAAPATLHLGPGGLNKVVDRLLEIGVLKEYKRATGDSGEPKYEVALLYRPALGVRLVGV
jgi:cellulose biosynthesis protein BcsQ